MASSPTTRWITGASPKVPSAFHLNCDSEVSSCPLQIHFLPTVHQGHNPHRIDPHTSGFPSTVLVSNIQSLCQPMNSESLGGYLWAFTLFQLGENSKEFWVDRNEGQWWQNQGWVLDRCPLLPVGDPTCSDCEELSCPGNLLGFTLFTSGYFGTHPAKPPGTRQEIPQKESHFLPLTTSLGILVRCSISGNITSWKKERLWE